MQVACLVLYEHDLFDDAKVADQLLRDFNDFGWLEVISAMTTLQNAISGDVSFRLGVSLISQAYAFS